MAQDIVDVLRDRHVQHSTKNQTIFSEAADEIERLRWELELAAKWRDNYRLEIERLQTELRRIETVASNHV